MELGMSHGKFSGKCHTCGKHGHKAAEYWSGGKKHYAPTGASLTSRLPHDKISNKKIIEKPSFSLYRVL